GSLWYLVMSRTGSASPCPAARLPMFLPRSVYAPPVLGRPKFALRAHHPDRVLAVADARGHLGIGHRAEQRLLIMRPQRTVVAGPQALERFSVWCSGRIPATDEVVLTLFRREAVERFAQVLLQGRERPLRRGPQVRLQLAERLLDRVQVRAVRRQE